MGARQSRAGDLSVGTEIDALGEDDRLWWPAVVTNVNGKKKLIEVQDETGFVQTISLSKKSDLKRIAKLGTHTRDALADPGERQEPDDDGDQSYERKYRDKKRGNEFTFPKSLLTRGKNIDVLDIFKSKKTMKDKRQWRRAVIVDIEDDSIEVHFEGWQDKYNVWINVKEERERIAPSGKHTSAVVAKSYKSKVDWELEEFKIGQNVYANDIFISTRTNQVKHKWRRAEIIDTGYDENGKRYKVHYKKWDTKYDTWLGQADGRIMSEDKY